MFDVETIRADFPILGQKVYGRPLVYFDTAATAQKPVPVIEAEARIFRETNANVHRGVHYLAERMTDLYEAARVEAARFIGAASEREIVFTSGATAAVNLVAYSYGALAVRAGDNLVVSEMEHHADLVPWQQLALRTGAELRVLPFDDEGRLCEERLAGLLDERTRIVCVTEASNVLGTRPDLRRIVETAHAAGVPVLVDGCQGAVHGGANVAELGCDFYVFSGHKLYGPTGIGVLYGRGEWLDRMPPFMTGGEMVDRVSWSGTTFAEPPLRFEAGTPNFAGAVVLAEAMRYLRGIDPVQAAEHERRLLERMTDRLMQIEGLRIYGTRPDKCPLVSFTVEGTHPYDLGMILDKLGIAVRTGQHCAEPVMTHYGVKGMCRASIGIYNTEAEVDALIEGVRRAVGMLR